jgi:hypothetical protein
VIRVCYLLGQANITVHLAQTGSNQVLLLNAAAFCPMSMDQGDISRGRCLGMPQIGSYEILLSIAEGNFAVNMS